MAKDAISATSDAGNALRVRFLNKAKVLRQLSKKTYIVDVYDFDELDDGTPCYVMPFLNSSLRSLLGSDDTDLSVLA